MSFPERPGLGLVGDQSLPQASERRLLSMASFDTQESYHGSMATYHRSQEMASYGNGIPRRLAVCKERHDRAEEYSKRFFTYSAYTPDLDARESFFVTGELSQQRNGEHSSAAVNEEGPSLAPGEPLDAPPGLATLGVRWVSNVESRPISIHGGKVPLGPRPLANNGNVLKRAPQPTTALRKDPRQTLDISLDGTDDSSSAEDDESMEYFDERKQNLINSVMRHFCARLHIKLASVRTTSRGQQETTPPPPPPNPRPANQQSSSSGSSGQTTRSQKALKRRREISEEGEEEEDDADADNDQDVGPPDPSLELKRFACPYYKRNPQRFLDEKTCRGPGWNRVHSVKEHIYRRHAPLVSCPRCWAVFASKGLLDEHLQNDPICEKSTKQNEIAPFDHCTGLQYKELKSRKRGPGAVATDEEKWNRIFNILFPDDETVPSPYYHPDDLSNDETTDILATIRREVPCIVRRELEAFLEPLLGGLDSETRAPFQELMRVFPDRLRGPLNSFLSRETRGRSRKGTTVTQSATVSQSPSQATATNMATRTVSLGQNIHAPNEAMAAIPLQGGHYGQGDQTFSDSTWFTSRLEDIPGNICEMFDGFGPRSDAAAWLEAVWDEDCAETSASCGPVGGSFTARKRL